MSILLQLLALLFLPLAALAAPWPGVVTHVTDGDTVWVQRHPHSEARRVRLDGIDAPEICQTWGLQSRTLLTQRLLYQAVLVWPRRHDDYGRLLARLEHQGDDVGAWMVSQGAAWSYQYRGQPGPYALQEWRARQAGLGLFGSVAPQRPRAFRQQYGSCHS